MDVRAFRSAPPHQQPDDDERKRFELPESKAETVSWIIRDTIEA
jgi:hypothetical protein